MIHHRLNHNSTWHREPTHPGCRASAGGAGSAARWGGTGWSRSHSRGSQPTTAPWGGSEVAGGTARRAMRSCSSSGRAHTETGSRPEERETRCSWRCRVEKAHLRWLSISITSVLTVQTVPTNLSVSTSMLAIWEKMEIWKEQGNPCVLLYSSHT